MRFSSMMVVALFTTVGMAGCGGGGGIESGVPTDVPQGVAPVFETKPISPKDMPKNKGTGAMVPTAPVPGKK